jgi:hypothetical protein
MKKKKNSQHNYSWLYADYLALDSNFRLKCKDRGLHSDGAIAPGWAYMVKQTELEEELIRVKANPSNREVNISQPSV